MLEARTTRCTNGTAGLWKFFWTLTTPVNATPANINFPPILGSPVQMANLESPRKKQKIEMNLPIDKQIMSRWDAIEAVLTHHKPTDKPSLTAMLEALHPKDEFSIRIPQLSSIIRGHPFFCKSMDRLIYQIVSRIHHGSRDAASSSFFIKLFLASLSSSA